MLFLVVYELMKISQIAQFVVVVVHDDGNGNGDDDKWLLKEFSEGLFSECGQNMKWKFFTDLNYSFCFSGFISMMNIFICSCSFAWHCIC